MGSTFVQISPNIQIQATLNTMIECHICHIQLFEQKFNSQFSFHLSPPFIHADMHTRMKLSSLECFPESEKLFESRHQSHLFVRESNSINFAPRDVTTLLTSFMEG